MKIIAHRANLNGPSKNKENTIDQIFKCIKYGFDVEIDVRIINQNIFLGHDQAKESITLEKLSKISNYLWIHCKNIEALEYFNKNNFDNIYNYFWHQDDKYTLTSKGYIWSYPGSILSPNSINVLPEWSNEINKLKFLKNDEVHGICTDFPLLIKD